MKGGMGVASPKKDERVVNEVGVGVGGSISNGESGRRVDLERVCSPASDTNDSIGSSSSSLMTHSTHTAVPSPSRTPGFRQRGDTAIDEDQSEATETRTVRREGSVISSEQERRRRAVGTLVEKLHQNRVFVVITLVMGLMGVYYQTRSGRRKRGSLGGWIRQSVVDFVRMSFKGLAL